MKKFKGRITRSLSFKLTIPVFLLGLVTLTIIIGVEFLRASQHIEKTLELEHKDILETLAISSEANNTVENLQRVVFSLASRSYVKQLTIISSRTRSIISDSNTFSRDRDIQSSLDQSQQQAFAIFSQNDFHDTEVSTDNIQTRFSSLTLFDSEINRLCQHWVMVTLDTTSQRQLALKNTLTVISIFVVGLNITLLGTFWVLQHQLISPLLAFVATVRAPIDSNGHRPLIKHQRQDELGLLADTYNRLVADNQQRHQELSAYAEDIKLSEKRADEANNAKSSFLANMSHEIRTPLNGVLGMIQLLEKSSLEHDQKHKLAVAKSSGESLLGIINDILDFSKIEAGKLDFEKRDFDLRAMIGASVEVLALRAQEKNVEVILDIAGIEASLVQSDATRIRQVLNNLVSNAVKFTALGEVEITATLTSLNKNTNTLTLTVRDTGIGIPENKFSSLFKSFTQVESTTTREYGGTGLGLTITKRLCELMDGSIVVTSELGVGSCFHATLNIGKSTQAIPVIPPLNHLDSKAIIVSTHSSNARAIGKQLTVWGMTTTETNSLSDCEALLQTQTNEDTRLIVFVDAELYQSGIEANIRRFLTPPWTQCNKILMASLGYSMEIEQFKASGFCFSFPKPATTEGLFGSLAAAQQLVTDHNAMPPQLNTHTTSPTNASQHKKVKILLVEDNAVNQEIIICLLEDLDIVPTIANNGQEAVDLITTDQFDLILMDCQMPLMDGYQATQYIRSDDSCSHSADIPIIALTANAMEGDRERCLAAGMNDYLIKPLDFDQLCAAIQRWTPDNS
jgi:signal transduction histidine kinase/CheY-like chemotaxis protein